MEKKWKGWAGADAGTENPHPHTHIHTPLVGLHVSIHSFTRRERGCRRHIEKTGESAVTHREVQGPWALARVTLAHTLYAGGG